MPERCVDQTQAETKFNWNADAVNENDCGSYQNSWEEYIQRIASKKARSVRFSSIKTRTIERPSIDGKKYHNTIKTGDGDESTKFTQSLGIEITLNWV